MTTNTHEVTMVVVEITDAGGTMLAVKAAQTVAKALMVVAVKNLPLDHVDDPVPGSAEVVSILGSDVADSAHGSAILASAREALAHDLIVVCLMVLQEDLADEVARRTAGDLDLAARPGVVDFPVRGGQVPAEVQLAVVATKLVVRHTEAELDVADMVVAEKKD